MVRDFLQTLLIVIVSAVVAYFAYFYSKVYPVIPTAYVSPIYAIIVLVGGYLLTRIMNAIIARTVEPTLGRTRGRGAKNFFQIVAGILVLIAIFAVFGYNFTSWLVGAGFIGIVLGLAAQQVLGNIFAGVSLLASRPFEIGDRITLSPSSFGIISSSYAHEDRVNGFTGTIQDVGIFYTKMSLDEGTPVVLPNSVVIGSLVFNHSLVKRKTVRIRIDLDKRIKFSDFKSQLIALVQSKPNEIIDPSSLHVDLIDVSVSTYQVVVWVWANSVYEEPVKTVLIQYALEIRERLAPKQ